MSRCCALFVRQKQGRRQHCKWQKSVQNYGCNNVQNVLLCGKIIQSTKGAAGMIATTVVDDVRRMLREGSFSQREIAKKLGISRGTVNAIALGRRRDRTDLPPADHGFRHPDGEPLRCPICGVLAQMPCLACYLRRRVKRSSPKQPVFFREPSRGTSERASPD